ncbi:hypothetical protein [Pelomonas aquatica]|nr:hypothetical protein [Pelomonas aquatica]
MATSWPKQLLWEIEMRLITLEEMFFVAGGNEGDPICTEPEPDPEPDPEADPEPDPWMDYDSFSDGENYGLGSTLSDMSSMEYYAGLGKTIGVGVLINLVYDLLKNGYLWMDDHLKAAPGSPPYTLTPEMEAIIAGNMTA